MYGIERRASPEEIPPLEPLTVPDSDHSQSRTPPSQTLSANQEPERNLSQVTREIMAILKISFVLENKGNVARDHLASERTYLAYVRTSLACASAGVALVQLFTLSEENVGRASLNKYSKPLGGMIIVFGLLILVFGLVRYFAVQSALVRGTFPVARHTITIVAVVLGLLVIIVFTILVAERG